MTPTAVPPLRQALSNVSGSVSLACWIVLLLPQLIEQWRTGSSEGIAAGFLIIWALGDLTNLIGAVWAHLLPEVILLAIWYCMADVLLLGSYAYYRRLAKKEAAVEYSQHRPESAEQDPTQPLLNRRNSARRKASHERRRRDSLNELIEEVQDSEKGNVWTRIVLPILFVVAAGVFGYLVSGNGPEDEKQREDSNIAYGPQILGYISASLYLGARIPQIVQNHKRRSVYGLSLLFFVLSTLGNVTYAGSILLYRSDKDYVLLNMPWLLGSLGTIFEDIVIFTQFYIYQSHISSESALE